MVGAVCLGIGLTLTSCKLTAGQHITWYPCLPAYHQPQGKTSGPCRSLHPLKCFGANSDLLAILSFLSPARDATWPKLEVQESQLCVSLDQNESFLKVHAYIACMHINVVQGLTLMISWTSLVVKVIRSKNMISPWFTGFLIWEKRYQTLWHQGIMWHYDMTSRDVMGRRHNIMWRHWMTTASGPREVQQHFSVLFLFICRFPTDWWHYSCSWGSMFVWFVDPRRH